MSVHIKFRAAKDSDTIPIESENITVLDLKKLIVARKKLGKNFGVDYDLIITNALTNDEYRDESTSIAKNTSLIVSRLPISVHRSMLHNAPNSMNMNNLQSVPTSTIPAPLITGSMQDEFGNDPMKNSEENESAKINALIQQSHASVPSRFNNMGGGGGGGGYNAGGYNKHGGGGGYNAGGYNMSNGNHYHPLAPITIMANSNQPTTPQIPQEIKVPHANYICYRCNQPGHYINQCPTNGDPKFDHHKMRKASGIPKTFLKPLNAQLNSQSNSTTGPSTVLLPHGGVAVVMQNESEFTKLARAISIEEEFKKKQQPDQQQSNQDSRQQDKKDDESNTATSKKEIACAVCKNNIDLLKEVYLKTNCCLNIFCENCMKEYVQDGKKINKVLPDQCPSCFAELKFDDILQNLSTTSSPNSSKKRSLDEVNSPVLQNDYNNGYNNYNSNNSNNYNNNGYYDNSNYNNSNEEINKRIKYSDNNNNTTNGSSERSSKERGDSKYDSRDHNRESRDSRERDSYSSRDSRGGYNGSRHDSRDHRDSRDSRDTRERYDSRDHRDHRDSRDPKERYDSRDHRDHRDSRDTRYDSRDHREKDSSSSSSSSSYRGRDRR